MGRAAVLAGVLLLAGCGGAQQPAASLSAKDLGGLGGRDSAAHAINNQGQIVGYSNTGTRWFYGNPVVHAILWQNGTMRDLGTGGGVASEANDINERGQIVGKVDTRYHRSTPYPHAVLWQKGTLRKLEGFGQERAPSEALAINNRGQIVGWWNDRPALWEDGKLTLLPGIRRGSGRGEAKDINDRGQIVGEVRAKGSSTHAVLWENGKVHDLAIEGTATAINNHGQIVGLRRVSGDSPARGDCNNELATDHAFLWQNGKTRDLGIFSGDYSYAGAINNRGQVLGQTSMKCVTYSYDEILHAFLWQKGRTQDVGPLISGLGGAEAINDRGEIVGSLMLRLCDKGVACLEDHAFLWKRSAPPTTG